MNNPALRISCFPLHANTHDNTMNYNNKIYPFKHQDVCIYYKIHNEQNSKNIKIDIDIIQEKKCIKVHSVNFSIQLDAIDSIDANITDACRNILDHIQHYPENYWNAHDPQHQRITLLRAAEHYFAQANHSLRVSIHQSIKNIQQHYAYQA